MPPVRSSTELQEMSVHDIANHVLSLENSQVEILVGKLVAAGFNTGRDFIRIKRKELEMQLARRRDYRYGELADTLSLHDWVEKQMVSCDSLATRDSLRAVIGRRAYPSGIATGGRFFRGGCKPESHGEHRNSRHNVRSRTPRRRKQLYRAQSEPSTPDRWLPMNRNEIDRVLFP